MGLDMYLTASEYVSKDNWVRGADGMAEPVSNPTYDAVLAALGNPPVNTSDYGAGITIDLPMGYWRKANQVHNWFVKELGHGVDECQRIGVDRNDLEKLKTLCELSLLVPSRASEVLPTTAGFFFGSTEYDEWYYKDLQHTLEIVNRCLASKFDYFTYQASW